MLNLGTMFLTVVIGGMTIFGALLGFVGWEESQLRRDRNP